MSEQKETTETKRWCVVDDDSSVILRGPYTHQETAAVVRAELEMSCRRECRNLVIRDICPRPVTIEGENDDPEV